MLSCICDIAQELERQMDCTVELSVNVDKLRQQIVTLSDPNDGSNTLQSKLVKCHWLSWL